MKAYSVSTLHDDPDCGGTFIVPCGVEADSHFEAAQKRFSYLAAGSKANTIALLVKEGHPNSPNQENPQVFAVREKQVTTREVVE